MYEFELRSEQARRYSTPKAEMIPEADTREICQTTQKWLLNTNTKFILTDEVSEDQHYRLEVSKEKSTLIWP